MRITNSMMVKQFLTESNKALARVSRYQSQVDSTKRISNIADDPEGTLKALRARNKLSNLALYRANISTAESYLTEAESAVNSLNEILKTAYETVISAQSGAKTQEDFDILAEQLKNLQGEVLSIGNATIGSSYIFGGFNFTGTISGASKTPPFTVDAVTGDIIYNGINLSKFAWKAEYENSAALMAKGANAALDVIAEFPSATSDSYAKVLAGKASAALNRIVSQAKAALGYAREFGIDSGSTEYQNFEAFYNDIADVAERLSAAAAKELAGAGVVDPFDIGEVQTILNDASALIYDSGSGSPMSTAVDGLRSAMAIPPSVEAALGAEAIKKPKLKVGTSQEIEFTLTGLDLMGNGRENIYHLLGKCAQMLSSGDTAGLSEAITEIQNAQSSVLTLQTKVGSTQNRLSLMSSRYESSELNYTQMKSDAEDVDMAEAIMNLSTAQTVYNAALAGGAEIIKTSLIDFLR